MVKFPEWPFRQGRKPVGWTINKHVPWERIHSFSGGPDPDWTYTDKAGHKHYRDDDGSYPTLDSELYFCETCFDDHDGPLFCPTCFEDVRPGSLPPNPAGEMVQVGPVEIWLQRGDERVDITEEEYVALVKQEVTVDELVRSRRGE